jgi:ribosomal-protein-alanine N-acetyltransferase
MDDYWAWVKLRERSRAHLTEWEQDWTAEEMTAQAFRQRLKAYWREMKQGRAVPFLVFRRDDDALIGGVTLSNIRYGASVSASVGYWIGSDYLRRGYGTAAMEAALHHAFERLSLHRVEAACQPANAGSKALLLKTRFQQEGYARDYLNINGQWRDHLLFAIRASGMVSTSA